MSVSARLRSWISMSPRRFAGVVAVLAVIVAIQLLDRTRDLAAARAAWGDTTTVWQAVTPAVPGTPLAARPIEAPLALVPTDAVVADPNGALARQAVSTGEMIVTADIGRSLLDLLPAGWRAVAIRLRLAPPLVVGDAVDVVARGATLADLAMVIALEPAEYGELIATVAVPAPVAAAVAEAAGDDAASVALRRD